MDGAGSVIRMMIARGASDEVDGVLSAMPVGFSQALTRVSRKLYDTDTVFQPEEPGCVSLEEMINRLPTPILLFVLKPEGGGSALLCFEPHLVNALVELSVGATRNCVLRDLRSPTLVDNALCRLFAEGLAGALIEEVAKVSGNQVLKSLCISHVEEQPGRLALSFRPGSYWGL